MTQEQVLGLIRTGMAFLGGFLYTKVDAETWVEVTGVLTAFVAGIWSFVSKVKK